MSRIAVAVLASVALFSGAAKADIQFTVTDLGIASVGSPLQPMGLNNAGSVLASEFSFGNPFGEHAFLYRNGASIELLGTNGEPSFARSINDSGTSAGLFRASFNSPSKAALWDVQGVLQELANPAGGGSSAATAINAGGDVVGYVTTASGGQVAAHWNPDGELTELAGTASLRSLRADAITSGGDIYGIALGDSDGDQLFSDQHLVRWTGGVMMDLGALTCEIKGATGSGSILCNRVDVGGLTALLFTALGELALPQLPGGTGMVGQDIAENGDVVGTSFVFDSFGVRGVATAWLTGMPVNLNDLIDPTLGWDMTSAGAINEKGQIAAWGRGSDGLFHALLLSPKGDTGGGTVPEPGTLALVVLALGVTAIRFRSSFGGRRSVR